MLRPLTGVMLVAVLSITVSPARADECHEECRSHYWECSKNAHKWCTDNTKTCDNLEGQEKTDCQDNWKKNCKAAEDHCVDNQVLCHVVCKTDPRGGQSGSRLLRDTPCPPGTEPNPLGVCQVKLKATGETPDTAPDDGCPPGTVRGATDECVPLFFTAYVAQFREGRFLICPAGSKPGPLGVCALDVEQLGRPEGTAGDEKRSCPPGTKLGPRGECVPAFDITGQANVRGLHLLIGLAAGGELAPERLPEVAEILAARGVVPVEDVERSLGMTVESLRAEPQ